MSKKVLIGGLGALLVLGGGGAGGFLFFVKGGAPEEEVVEEVVAEPVMPVFVELQPISAPVIRKSRVRYYVHFGVSLQLVDEAAKERVYQQMPRLRDAFLRDLHGRSVMRSDDAEEIDFDAVKMRLMAQAEQVLGRGAVRDVLLTRALGG